MEEISAPGPHSGPPCDGCKWSYTNPLFWWALLPHWVSLVFLFLTLQRSGVVLPYLGLVHTPKIRGVISPPTGDDLPAPPGIAAIQLSGLDQVETSCLGSFIHQVLRTGTEAGLLHGDQQGVSKNGGDGWMGGMWFVNSSGSLGKKWKKCWANLRGEWVFREWKWRRLDDDDDEE